MFSKASSSLQKAISSDAFGSSRELCAILTERRTLPLFLRDMHKRALTQISKIQEKNNFVFRNGQKRGENTINYSQARLKNGEGVPYQLEVIKLIGKNPCFDKKIHSERKCDDFRCGWIWWTRIIFLFKQFQKKNRGSQTDLFVFTKRQKAENEFN